MQRAGELIRTVRQRHGISRTQLAIRAGSDEATISRLEQGGAPATPDQLQALLLVMGERPVFDDGGAQPVSSEPIPLEFDAEELADASAQGPSERLERSAQWNRLAAQLARAELRPLR